MKSQKIITSNFGETEKVGEEFGKDLKAGDVVCLYGNLGSGKTTFVKGVAKGLGITSRIISPTFMIIRNHELGIRNQGRGIKRLYHIDLYRLQHKQDIHSLELKDILVDKNAVVLIEWAEIAEELLSKERWDIRFEYVDEKKRRIEIVKI